MSLFVYILERLTKHGPRSSTGLVGVCVMILSMPANTLVARFMTRIQKEMMKVKDKRSRLMSEIRARPASPASSFVRRPQ